VRATDCAAKAVPSPAPTCVAGGVTGYAFGDRLRLHPHRAETEAPAGSAEELTAADEVHKLGYEGSTTYTNELGQLVSLPEFRVLR
jgi:hypothetical protein